MNRSLGLPALALFAVIAFAACTGASLGAPASRPTPSTPAATPVVTPAPVATPTATPAPSVAPTKSPSGSPSGDPIRVDLEIATDHHVTIEILDDGHHVVSARSGKPGDGASVAFGSLVARNVDPRTVQFTWSDTPGDATLGLYVSESVGTVLVIRPERAGGDAMAFDRVLIVEFDAPVDAASLHLGVQEGLDTAV